MIIELHAHWIRANQGFFGCGEDWRVEKWLSQSVSSKFAVYTSELTLRFLASSNPEAVRRSSSRGSSLRPGPERPRSLFHAKHDPQFPPGRNFFPSFPSFFLLLPFSLDMPPRGLYTYQHFNDVLDTIANRWRWEATHNGGSWRTESWVDHCRQMIGLRLWRRCTRDQKDIILSVFDLNLPLRPDIFDRHFVRKSRVLLKRTS